MARVMLVSPVPDFTALFERFSKRREAMFAGRIPSEVDRARESLYYDCVEKAALPPGIFRLPADTGLGKTLAAAGFALRHASVHDMRRVIVVTPFITITSQNLARYREMLDTDDESVVVEHHSSANVDDSRVRCSEPSLGDEEPGSTSGISFWRYGSESS